jgi:hypothetical protein
MDWATLGAGVAFVLTLMVFSYLIGDNVVFQIAEHLLVGVSIGWATLQILFGVVVPAVDTIWQESSSSSPTVGIILTYAIPLGLGLLLLLRSSRAARPLTNLIIGLVIGTVAALSLAGAVAGTLVPQVGQTIVSLRGGEGKSGADIIGNIVLVLGALLSLAYFQFTVMKKESDIVSPIGNVGAVTRMLGRWSLMLAFGAVFGAVFLTYFAALIDRLIFLINAFS